MPWGIMQWGTTSTTGHTIDEATRVRQREWLAARAAPRWRLAALSFGGAWVVTVAAASWLLLRPEPEPNYWAEATEIEWTPTPGDSVRLVGDVDLSGDYATLSEDGEIRFVGSLCTRADLIRILAGQQRECMGIGDDGVTFMKGAE
jgi:hypothetical protein